MNNERCSECGSFGCNVRAARGLKRFCELETPKKVWDGLYASYSEAVAASPVGRARWVKGGGTTGSPARFMAVTA